MYMALPRSLSLALFFLPVLEGRGGLKISFHIPSSYVDHQRRLVPKHADLLISPVSTLGPQFHVEVPDQACDDEPHFVERQVPPDAVAGTEAEGLVRVAAVVEEGRGGVSGGLGEPALGQELGGSVPVAGGVEGG